MTDKLSWIDIRQQQPDIGQMVLFIAGNTEGKYKGLLGKAIQGEYIGCLYYEWGGIFDCGDFQMYGSHWIPMDVLPLMPKSEAK